MKKILLLLCIVACYISGSAQTFTVSKSPMESGEQITVTGSGETDEAYFSSMTLITTGMTSSPNAFGSTYVQITGPTEMNTYNTVTDAPSNFKIVIANSHPTIDYTITFQVKTTVNSTAPGSTPTPNVIKYVTVTVKKVPEPTNFGNVAKSQVFYKNDCGPGFASDPYTYSVSAGTFTANSQAAANALADADIAANGQNAANANRTCKQIYYNTEVTQSFTKNNCGSGYTGSIVTYIVPANKHQSLISQIDANQKATNDLNTNGQTYANTNGTCTEVRTRYRVWLRANGTCSADAETSIFVWIHSAVNFSNYDNANLANVYTTQSGTTKIGAGEYRFFIPLDPNQSGYPVFTINNGQITSYSLCQ